MAVADAPVIRDATFSLCGAYRYRLGRRWDAGAGRACFVMLNPSTADAERDDPTIRRCIGFAQRWGYSSLEVVNLFAFRATNPAALRDAGDPIGADSDRFIEEAASGSDRVVCAWGADRFAQASGRATDVLAILKGCSEARCLGVTSEGHPRHPLYVRAETRTRRFTD